MALFWQSSWFWLILLSVIVAFTAYAAVSLSRLNKTVPVSATPPSYQASAWQHTVTLDPPLIFSEPLHIPLEHENPPDDDMRPPDDLPEDPALIIMPPRCYVTVNDGYDCLGQVRNTTAQAWGDVALSLQWGTSRRQFALEQRLIPPQSSAPYRVLLDNLDADNAAWFDRQAQSLALRLNTRHPPASERHQLTLVDAVGSLSPSGVYDLTVTMNNNSGALVDEITIFTTLCGEEWDVVGYHAYVVAEPLANDQNRQIQYQVIPYAIPDNLHHYIHIEARIKR